MKLDMPSLSHNDYIARPTAPPPGSVRFMHIPKTAGTSLTDCLARMYRDTYAFHLSYGIEAGEINAFNAALKKQAPRLVMGHYPLRTGNDYLDSMPTITFLRDPIKRVESFCHHVARGDSAYLRDKFPPENFSYRSFLASGNFELENLITKSLVGFAHYERHKSDKDGIYQEAIDLLENRLLAFGLIERFDESMALFAHKLKWHSFGTWIKLNTKKKTLSTSPLSDQDRNGIAELNDLDIRLFSYARGLFNKRLEEVPDMALSLEQQAIANKRARFYLNIRKHWKVV